MTALLPPTNPPLAQTTMPPIPYRPFLDPLPVHDAWWVFLLPLALAIAVVYKTVQMRDLTGYAKAVGVMTVQIILGMLLLGVASYALVAIYVRHIAEYLAG